MSSPHTPPRELRWISTVCRGGRPGERGIEAQKRPTPLLTASDLDLSLLSHGCVLGWARGSGGYAVRAVRPPYVRAHALWASVGFVPNLLEAAFYLASLVRPGSPGTSRVVPPPHLIDLSPFPRNEDGPRQEVHHQPFLTASGLDLSHLLAACPELSSRRWRCAARTFVRFVRSVRSVRSVLKYFRAPWGSVGARTKPPGSGILLGFFGTSVGSYPANRFVPPPRALRGSVRSAHRGGTLGRIQTRWH